MGKQEGSAVAGVFWSLSPVVAITSAWDGKINGQIAVTVITSSVVHTIPRLIVGIWKGNYTHEFIYNSKKLCIHLLRRDQLELVKNFGFYTGRERKKFKDIPYETDVTGCPILLDCHSFAECEIINAMDGGDMTPFLVSVVNGGVRSNEQWMTLDYFYNYAPPHWIEEYSHKLSKTVETSLECIHNIDYKSWEPGKDNT
jgi:flavin reductase (DIM6/NTAB) family NADH-FMN oxidoreductase RutF